MSSNIDFVKAVRFLLKYQTQMQLSQETGVHQGVISELNRGVAKPKMSYVYGVALESAYRDMAEKVGGGYE